MILLDIVMPTMDGYEVCRSLKSIEQTKEIPVLFLTSKTEEEDIVKGFDVGASDYISKPIKSASVCARVANHVKSHLTQNALSISRATLEHTLNSIQDGIITFDLNGTVTFINHIALKLADKRFNEAVGLKIDHLFHLYNKKEEYNLQYEIRSVTQENRDVVLRRGSSLVNLHGKVYVIEGKICPLQDTNNNTHGSVMTISNIGNQIAMERALIQADKLKALGVLSAGVAHEMNNPLGTMLQSGQNIKRRLDASLKANINAAEKLGLEMGDIKEYASIRKIDDFLDGIQESGDRAAKIISHLLALTDEPPEARSTQNMVNLIEQALTLSTAEHPVSYQRDFKKINIVRDYLKSCPDIICNSTDLIQAIYNILKNASAALIAQSNAEIKLLLKQHGDTLILEISDNGSGIDPLVIDRIFEPFYTTREPGEGIGLGLTIAYTIITHGHDGSLTIDSEQGKSTKVTLTLPIQLPPKKYHETITNN